ncbi:metallophosphoesterase family protein [Halovenus rubra]|uniref:Metallophosphoesterase family protein n=2 Tax=Halovenus rubra TaxID=869890 RepID=A0ACC7E1T2_9EURY|nr:metallophosphoesterase family protein [Halovenus rubra]
MDIGILSDIHGNKVALETVLEDMPPVDGIVCAGDIVGYNPWHGECIETIHERQIPTVMGNHDRAVAGNSSFGFNSMAGAGVQHAQETLSDDETDWLATLPEQRREFDGRIKIVHSHPERRGHYTYPEEFSRDLLGEESVLVLGHTHVQHHEIYADGIVMNPGSVGQPRDSDPRAAYSILDLADLSVTEHRVEYDIERVQTEVDRAGLPERIGNRLVEGR